jgi:hypothetical protein
MRGHFGLRPDLLDYRAHCLVRDAQLPSDSPQSRSLSLDSDLRPALSWDSWPFRYDRVAANPGSPSSEEQSLGIKKRDERQLHHIYLA